MDDVKHIGHSLCRVVDIALQVHERRLLLKDSVLVALRYGVNNLVHVSISLADIHIVADTDHVSHEGDHVRRLADGLTVSNLRLAFVKVLNFQAKQVTSGSKGEACTGRIVTE